MDGDDDVNGVRQEVALGLAILVLVGGPVLLSRLTDEPVGKDFRTLYYITFTRKNRVNFTRSCLLVSYEYILRNDAKKLLIPLD